MKQLNDEHAKSDLRSKIERAVARLEEADRLRRENTGYMVQYVPCGHSREIAWDEFELVHMAKERAKTNHDAYIQSSRECPECNRAWQLRDAIDGRR